MNKWINKLLKKKKNKFKIIITVRSAIAGEFIVFLSMKIVKCFHGNN